MDIPNKATRIDLFSLSTTQMRTFHMTWFAFFLCFFAWFGLAPLTKVWMADLSMTKIQVKNTIIAGVAVTILARLVIGWLCDKIGPRLCYTWLLMIGSLPVMGVGFANSYETLLMFRLGIGVIGASFVITQYHTSLMFAPNVVGAANATTAGWGNLGGGITQMVMPLILAFVVSFGANSFWGWRISMIIAGGICFITGIAYYFVTTDTPDGNFKDLRAAGKLRSAKKVKGTFAMAAKDKRVWALFFVYAACFGIELTINGMAAVYFADYFDLSIKTAGLVAGLFGLMNIFARTTGGIIGDRFARNGGLKGRVHWLFIALLCEGIALLFFSQMTVLPIAIAAMIVFSLFVQMSEGATYSVVPFINKKALGSVAGIVGAGGNMGAVAAGFLFREFSDTHAFLFTVGCIVIGISFVALLVRFTPEFEAEIGAEFKQAQKDKAALKLKAAAKPWIQVPALPDLVKGLNVVDALRAFLGIALVMKGIYFILNMGEFDKLAGDLGELQNIIAWYVVFAHCVGGFALIVGIATRFSAFLNLTVITGAIVFVHSSEPLFAAASGLQFTIFVLFSLLLIIWKGAGNISFDEMMKH